jgi:hypothetical protein
MASTTTACTMQSLVKTGVRLQTTRAAMLISSCLPTWTTCTLRSAKPSQTRVKKLGFEAPDLTPCSHQRMDRGPTTGGWRPSPNFDPAEPKILLIGSTTWRESSCCTAARFSATSRRSAPRSSRLEGDIR